MWQSREKEWLMCDPKKENEENRIYSVYHNCLFSLAGAKRERDRYFSKIRNLLLSNEE